MLGERYTREVAQKIIGVIEEIGPSLHRMNIRRYAKLCQEILYGSQQMYKKILFECLSNNKRMICEHSLFQVLEMFREKDSYFFYRELLDAKKIPRYYNEINDDSDKTFFEAFAEDLRLVSQCLDFKKRIEGIYDNDMDEEFDSPFEVERYGDVDIMMLRDRIPSLSVDQAHAICKKNWETFETDMVQQIVYLMNKITSGKSAQDKVLHEMLHILLNCTNDKELDLLDIRGKLVDLCYDKKVLEKRKKKLMQKEISTLKD